MQSVELAHIACIFTSYYLIIKVLHLPRSVSAIPQLHFVSVYIAKSPEAIL